MTTLVVFDRPGDLAHMMEKAGYDLHTTDLVLDQFSCRVFTWKPPTAPKLQQLLEQAAIIAVRDDSAAAVHIKRALEACRGKEPTPTENSYLTEARTTGMPWHGSR